MKFDETFILSFVKQHLGDQAVGELKEIWQKGFKPISKGVSSEEKYETAYGNWIWLAKNIYSFIRKHMGEDGIKKFERAEVQGLKKKNSGPGLFVLNLIRVFSPNTSFVMTAKQMGYKLQWLTPFSISDLTPDKMVFDIPRCKILDFPDTEDLYILDCQRTYPAWMAEQFKINMKFNRRGKSCMSIITRIS